jgi:hypothetical protein
MGWLSTVRESEEGEAEAAWEEEWKGEGTLLSTG